MKPIVDVMIPTKKPKKEFLILLDRLERQSVKPNRIIMMNTGEKYLKGECSQEALLRKYTNLEIYHISENEFDHGNTRNEGIRKSKAPFFVCMTQDAVPADEYLLERLLEPLIAGKAAVSYARQLPKEDCNPVERFVKSFNYPDKSRLKSRRDLDSLGIKTFFCSNACAAYNRTIFEESGGFIRHTIFNEDMIYAAGIISSGGKIAYTAKALVCHSHNYSWQDNFRRNFDLGVSQADHPEIFGGVKSESEGVRLVRETMQYLKKTGNKRLIPSMLWGCGWKRAGYRLGKMYKKLPGWFILKCSMNRNYWQGMRER